jgi:hypothetical protein
MSKKLEIKINQSIIATLGRKLYTSKFAEVILRELIQNALDANADKIGIEFERNTNTYAGKLIVRDNGSGIVKIEGLLDTLGESIKDDSINNIGGYGIAKLAIFGCKSWKFTSISGSFSTGFIFDESETTDYGTIVECELEKEDLIGFEDSIKTYCSTINRECDFYYNSEYIQSINYQEVNFGLTDELTAETSFYNRIVVRVNGLPTFSERIMNLNKTVFFDYWIDSKPYDPEYPLSSNRDGFLPESKEHEDYLKRKTAIQEKVETDKKLSENLNKKSYIKKYKSKKYLVAGELTDNQIEMGILTLKFYKKYLIKIHKILNNENSILESSFGLTDGANGEDGMYESKIFWIKYNIYNNGDILATAIHEYTHYLGYGLFGHDQAFSSAQTSLTGCVLNKMNWHF